MLIALRIASQRITSETVPWQLSCCLLQIFAGFEPLPFEGLDG